MQKNETSKKRFWVGARVQLSSTRPRKLESTLSRN